jgi:glycosyltransferase involved in cell wall biosynthesis
MKEGYLPQEQRKKILLLSDDLRMPSGVGVMSKEIVLGIAHRYNIVQLGAAVSHPEQGQIMDASASVNEVTGLTDAYVRIYPYSGYGDQQMIRQLMMMERPDAIMIFTDPRYFVWLFHMEREVREHMPIIYYTIWDDLPYPMYNQPYYRSCDSLFAISKQTHNIVRNVLTEKYTENKTLKYIPHGCDAASFKRLTEEKDLARLADARKALFGGDEVDFVVMYNNRNIRRKCTGDVVLAYQKFFHMLTPEQQEKTRLLMHTQPVDENGTDLVRVIQDLAPEIKVTFSANRLETETMNDLYNIADVVINIASNEGFGLGTLEAILAEKMIIVNVTGGLQDQCGFKIDGRYITEDDFTKEWGSNHDGRIRDHGEWVVPIFPVSRSLAGSPATPYIFDDRVDWYEAADAMYTVYQMPKEEREARGKAGREYATTNGFSAAEMVQRFLDGLEETFTKWTPRKRYELLEV